MWDSYQSRVDKGEQPKKVLDELGLDRYCCRALFMTNIDVLAKVAKFRI